MKGNHKRGAIWAGGRMIKQTYQQGIVSSAW